ncbi:MAG: Fic family protein [Armatimonadetes bacterium]|nr:Fic family protein [Armatimonadota bacterium]
MSESIQHQIWPLDTGITDLAEDTTNLAIPAIANIREVWAEARKKLENTDQLRVFNERLAREWAIETGVIEDVFHIDKGVTVNLIEQGISAALLEHGTVDKPADYVVSILRDHVETLDWLMERFIAQKQPLSAVAVKELHRLMTDHQSHVDAQDPQGRPIRVELRKGDWKIRPNNALREGVLYCYCPPEQVPGEMERLVEIHAQHEAGGMPPEVASAWIHHRFTQIHPFQDGNGRVARALATLVFLRAGLFPVVVNREVRTEYIRALEQADAGDLTPLVEVLSTAQQVRFDRALNISDELTSVPTTVELAIQALKDKLRGRAEEVAQQQRGVFQIAKALQQVTWDRLNTVAGLLEPIRADVHSSDVNNDFFYRGQIVEEARRFGYYANTTVYRAWARLTIGGSSPALLLFSFHGRGGEFAGVMVCSPIFELINENGEEEGQRQRTQIPIADRPFEFYFTEEIEAVKGRFLPWLDETIALAVSQYQRLI